MDATHTPEDWRPIPGYEGLYEASSFGRVRSLTRTVPLGDSTKTIQGIVLKQRKFGTDRHPRKAVKLCVGGIAKVRLVHQLVLEAFVGPRPEGLEGCHNNGDPFDNRTENLRWDTNSANQLDSVEHGTHHEARKTECPQGHPYDAVNTAIVDRKRRCKTCHRNREAARYRTKSNR